MRNAIFIGLIYLSLQVYGQKHDDVDNKMIEIFNTNEQVVVDNIHVQADNQQGCKCVPYYRCSANNTIIPDAGSLFIDGAAPFQITEHGDCPSYLEVCCYPSEKIEEPILPAFENKGCGYRNPEGVGFRIRGNGDNEAQFGEFPWMVGVLEQNFNVNTNTTLNSYKCGGSLIHPQAVLTAAHCVSPSDKKYKIRAGEWDTQTHQEIIPHQDHIVKSIKIHDKYSAAGLLNDVAILFLESPVKITSTVNTLCLPSQDLVVPSGTRCYASGWGRHVFGTYQTILRKVDVPIVPTDTCQEQLRSTLLGKQFILDKSFICAGDKEGKNSFKDDDGSPLACPIPGQKDRYQHIGMVSWSLGCGKDNSPAVYVNVPMFRTWIDEALSAQHLQLNPTP